VAAGFLAGVNISKVSVDPSGIVDETKFKAGFAAGVFVSWSFSPMIAIQPEVLYSQKGFQVSEDNGTQDEKWGWIEVPLLAQIGKSRLVYALAGPAFSFLTRAKTEIGNRSEDVKDELQKVDVSIVVGAGFRIMEHFGVEAQWDQGLRDINKSLG